MISSGTGYDSPCRSAIIDLAPMAHRNETVLASNPDLVRRFVSAMPASDMPALS
jgi:hypothetical protein